MRIAKALGLFALVAGSLTACNDGSPGTTINTSTAPGTLIQSPPFRVASLNAAAFAAQLGATSSGQQLLALSTPNPALNLPTCGVDMHYFQYQTVGGKNEPTTASGAIMAPTGSAACTTARPVLVYTHGTAVTKGYNLANILDSTNEAWTESAMMAAFYAAHGFIVIASNYAGYDSSSLPYTPYLNADAESKDVINAYHAAMSAISAGLPSGVTASSTLFVTGYSQGGHVAMATVRAMQAANITVHGSAPMSGPYAMLAFGDAAVAFSNPSLGGTIYYPMIINSYQQAYGGLYTALTDVYNPAYATGIDTLIPGQYTFTTLITSGKLPQFAIFDSATPSTGVAALDAILSAPSAASNPIAALGFGTPYLINNSERVSYAIDATTPGSIDGEFLSQVTQGALANTGLPPATKPVHPLRAALWTNDLRSFVPSSPMMLCGGHDDPEVWYSVNTYAMQQILNAQVPQLLTVVDVDPGSPLTAGGIYGDIGTIAATSYGTDLAHNVTSVATLANDVQAAVITHFISHFSVASGTPVPIDPQGVEVAGLASVAAQAVTQYYSASAPLTPAAMGADVSNAVVAYYHFPFTQLSCEVAAQAYFAAIP